MIENIDAFIGNDEEVRPASAQSVCAICKKTFWNHSRPNKTDISIVRLCNGKLAKLES
jgi:hypothetical protein